ncbi:glycosyltransferase [Niallia circulans]|nr:glycosyltransferase [Niallia circulans]
MHVGEYVNGGVATYLNEVVEYQKKSSEIDQVYLMMSEYNSDLNIFSEKNNLILYKYKRSFFSILLAIYYIYKRIKEIKPDIVHVHSTFAGFFVRIPLFFHRRRFKVVYCSHGWSFLMDTNNWKKKIFGMIEHILSIKTDVIINISEFEYQESIRYRIPIKKSKVIYNGLSNRAENNANIVKGNKIHLLFVGRFDYQKGLDILLDFFKVYKNSNIVLDIVGAKVLSKNNTDTNLSNVNYHGWINNADIDKFYRNSDAIIIPSRWEGFGLVAVEAMRNKKPVIASNRGALPEIIKHNENGYIFDLNNLSELKEILSNLTKERLERMGQNAYKSFLQNFTSDTMNQKIISLYNEI